jgi:hypothetical protein
MPEQAVTTESTPRRTMTWRVINELEAGGDIATLAAALRNLILITDHATSGAQAAANARQEYVPTILYKDDLYQAMDTALRGEPYDPYARPVTFDDEFEEQLEEPDPADGTDYRPLARALQMADDQWNRHADGDNFDPDEDYIVWVAKEAQAYLDSDQKARDQPVELRGECATDTPVLPGWDEMSDADKGAAMLHLRRRDWWGDAVAIEAHPCRYFDHPALVALSPAAASEHANGFAEDQWEDLDDAEFERLIRLGRAAEEARVSAMIEEANR